MVFICIPKIIITKNMINFSKENLSSQRMVISNNKINCSLIALQLKLSYHFVEIILNKIDISTTKTEVLITIKNKKIKSKLI